MSSLTIPSSLCFLFPSTARATQASPRILFPRSSTQIFRTRFAIKNSLSRPQVKYQEMSSKVEESQLGRFKEPAINILDEIIRNKHEEVALLKEMIPLHALSQATNNIPPRDFILALKESHIRTGLPALIAEVKKASPSRGVLREHFDPVEIAQAYEEGGAACISVLADKKYFQGSFEYLQSIRNAGVQCPLLCKEFIIDEWQIYYAKTNGADAILLIAAVLQDHEIIHLAEICKMLGLAALVEVHNEKEIDRVLAIDGIQLIGINNRNLETFDVDVSNTKNLLDGERGRIICQKDIIVVSESGLYTPNDIAYVSEAGAKAILVGESIVKQNDPKQAVTRLFGKEMF